MLKKRRAQGLSVNVIIIAVIALIVLIVLVAIFTGRLAIFTRGIGSTGDATKTCLQQEIDGYDTELSDECKKGEVSIVSSDAVSKGKLCCKKPEPEPEG